MSYGVIYGLDKPRITLYADDGVTPVYRITLQKETKEGLDLAFPAEGVSRQLGSGAGWAKPWLQRGFRPVLNLKWSHGLDSAVEAWGGIAWGAGTTVNTAQALGVIDSMARRAPCLVEPHLDQNFSFLAQPDPGKAITLRDLKGLVHTGLELQLVATKLISDHPDWPNLNNYFEPGFIDPDFINAKP
jgi:hypothetical protein